MSRQAMIIDMDRCVGCGACVIACQEEWDLPEDSYRNWVRPMPPSSSRSSLVFTHYVGLCGHCEDAPCLDVCPVGATFRDNCGRIIVEPGTCIGCGYCIETCPFGARMYRKDLGRVEKCNFCAPRVDAGQQPACVATCPAGSRIFGDLDDKDSAVSRYLSTHHVAKLETDEVRTKPNVFYAGKKELVDLIFFENPPDPQKMHSPIEGKILASVVSPGSMGLIGLVITGGVISFLRQLSKRKQKESDAMEPEGKALAARPTLKRHDKPVIALHWFNALVWLFQLVTGIGLLGTSKYRVTPDLVNNALLSLFGSRQVMLQLHFVIGAFWLSVLLAFGFFGVRRYLIPFFGELALNRADLRWLRLKPKEMFLSSKIELPPQGKYNAGQKLFGIGIAVLIVLIVGSGLVITLAPGSEEIIRWAITVHFAAVMTAVALLVLHVYMTVFNSAERPAFFSMLSGRVSESYARKHNRLWWEKTRPR